MILESLLENLSIFTDNLSIFYIICALVSFIAVWFTWNMQPSTSDAETKDESTEDSLSDERSLPGGSDESMGSLITSAQDKKDFIKAIEKTLSSDDRAKENEIEKQQLNDILDVMKRDEKFSATTMEELQEQLKLYRE